MSKMDPDDAREAQQLLAYADNTAGGLMTTNPVILSPDTTVATALAHIRREELAQALAAVVCVTRPPLETPTGRFLGIVHFQKLLREPPTVAIGSIIESGPEFLSPSDNLGTISRKFATYNLLALPVLDEEKRLVGVVSVDDVLDHILPSGWRETEFELAHE
jgi:Mg/Co/Ni transporter MgtE